MAPTWLERLSQVWILLSLASAAMVAADLVRRPQKMRIMNLVWPLTALYAGLLGVWGYFAIGRASRPGGLRSGADLEEASAPSWRAVLIGSTHCGAGCAVGDVAGEWLVFATGWTLLGSELLCKYAAAFALAYVFGIAFQFFSIAPMRRLGLKDGLVAAVKADTLSLIAFEVGMFGCMAITQKVLLPGLEPTSWSYWLMMQIAMLLGLATTYPVNAWLIRHRLKEVM